MPDEKVQRSWWKGGLLSVLPVAAVATAGSLLTDTNSPWYRHLLQPSFAPPDAAFPIAWSIVYLCCAAAIWLYYAADGRFTKGIWALLLLNGGLNVAWTAVFFRLHSPIGAVLVLFALLVCAVWLCRAFWKKRWYVGALLLPYIGWAGFAIVLNYAIALLN